MAASDYQFFGFELHGVQENLAKEGISVKTTGFILNKAYIDILPGKIKDVEATLDKLAHDSERKETFELSGMRVEDGKLVIGGNLLVASGLIEKFMAPELKAGKSEAHPDKSMIRASGETATHPALHVLREHHDIEINYYASQNANKLRARSGFIPVELGHDEYLVEIKMNGKTSWAKGHLEGDNLVINGPFKDAAGKDASITVVTGVSHEPGQPISVVNGIDGTPIARNEVHFSSPQQEAAAKSEIETGISQQKMATANDRVVDSLTKIAETEKKIGGNTELADQTLADVKQMQRDQKELMEHGYSKEAWASYQNDLKHLGTDAAALNEHDSSWFMAESVKTAHNKERESGLMGNLIREEEVPVNIEDLREATLKALRDSQLKNAGNMLTSVVNVPNETNVSPSGGPKTSDKGLGVV